MKILDRLAARFGYAPARKPQRRSLDAGTVSRLTQSWAGATGSIDRDIWGKLELARNRARDLAYNNDYMRKFVNLVRTNVVGPQGFSLQVRAAFPDGKQDKIGNDAVESAFWRWAKRGVCEVSRKYSFPQLCHQIVGAAARDGEALVRRWYSGNDYRYSLQLLDIDRLDLKKNEQLADGRIIKMGVELGLAGEPVAYHLRRQHPGDIYPYRIRGEEFERVPASEIFHIGVFERPEQTRCLPWAVSAILRLENLGAYEEAAVIASRFGAAKMAYWAPGEGGDDPAGFADESNPSTGEFFSDFEPGEVRVAPSGAELKSIDWKYPHEQYDVFVKACVRGIASGIGVAYSSLSNDLTQVNYSSIRAGVLEERDAWMLLQGWLIESFLEPMFEDWLRMALLTGQVTTKTGGAVGPDKFAKFNCAEWRGRRWAWVDPEKDVNAAILLIQNGLRSRRMIADEQGVDLEQVWADLELEQAEAKKKGLTFGALPKGNENGKGKQTESTDDDAAGGE